MNAMTDSRTVTQAKVPELLKVSYTRRDGAGCTRLLREDQCMEYLQGKIRGVKEVRVTDWDGNVYGIRERAADMGLTPDDRRVKWLWFWSDYGDLRTGDESEG